MPTPSSPQVPASGANSGTPTTPPAVTEYPRRLALRRRRLGDEQQRHRTVGNVRVVVFLLGLALGIETYSSGALSWWWLTMPVAVLIWLGAWLTRVERRIALLADGVAFYEHALARLEDRWQGRGEPGTRWLDPAHLSGPDLDLFGEGSLFELLCLARTERGQATLAAWLLTPADPDTIAARQTAVEELASRLDFREDTALAGNRTRSRVSADDLVVWASEPIRQFSTMIRALAWVTSAFGAAAALTGATWAGHALGLYTLAPDRLLAIRLFTLAVAVVCFGIHWSLKPRTDRTLTRVFKAEHDLTLLAALFARIEREPCASDRLVLLRGRLIERGRTASQRIGGLRGWVRLLAWRDSLGMKLLGPLVLWDLHVSQGIEGWRRDSGPSVAGWLDAAGEVEALSSLAGFRYERPRTVFADLDRASTHARFDGRELRHPLLPEARAVANDVELSDAARLIVVSGSNMSGKSTLLRTVGVNAVLALAGGPVCAAALRLTPLTVGASIRIQDSLREGTSRFYAEISRLSRIMATAGQTRVLFLVDEMLHGTNSHDRLIGAAAIVRGLLDRGAIGLITTHDLALARIADTVGHGASNAHFQDYLEDGVMRFDYRLRPGIVRHSNALALMRAVGLDVSDG